MGPSVPVFYVQPIGYVTLFISAVVMTPQSRRRR
jgi:hypothetical protein